MDPYAVEDVLFARRRVYNPEGNCRAVADALGVALSLAEVAVLPYDRYVEPLILDLVNLYEGLVWLVALCGRKSRSSHTFGIRCTG